MRSLEHGQMWELKKFKSRPLKPAFIQEMALLKARQDLDELYEGESYSKERLLEEVNFQLSCILSDVSNVLPSKSTEIFINSSLMR